jgi:glycerol uptake facilitator-like aquaporin
MKMSLGRRAIAEFLGTAFLVATVIGSGVMGERLANGNIAIALLANTIATGAALVALILAFGPIHRRASDVCTAGHLLIASRSEWTSPSFQ